MAFATEPYNEFYSAVSLELYLTFGSKTMSSDRGAKLSGNFKATNAAFGYVPLRYRTGAEHH